MGSCCCHNESPCASVEERSVLLKADTKATSWTGKAVVVGTCSSQDGDDMLRITPDESDLVAKVEPEAAQVKKCVEVEAPTNTINQENGPLKELDGLAASFPRRDCILVDSSTTAREEDEEVSLKDDEHTVLLQCTLNSPLKKQDKDNQLEVNTALENIDSASAQDKCCDIFLPLPVEAAGLESHTGIKEEAMEEHSSSATRPVDQELCYKIDPADAEAPSNCCENAEASYASCQSPFSSLVSQDMESASCLVTHGLKENGSSSTIEEIDCKALLGRDICESSSGLDPTESDRIGEEQGSALCAGEPVTSARGDASERTKPDQDTRPDLPCVPVVYEEVATSSTNASPDVADETMAKRQNGGTEPKTGLKEEEQEEAVHEVKEEEEGERKEKVQETPTGDGSDDNSQEASEKEEQPAGELHCGEAGDEEQVPAQGGPGSSEEDLYRAAEELSAGPPPPALSEDSRCSLDPAMEVLTYSEREWRGNTAKSALIRKGYKELSQRFGSLRRVRGDNYCALRATLFQVLCHSTQPPSWLQDDAFATLPEQLEAQEGLINQWRFPSECLQAEGTVDATLKLHGYLEQLWIKWRAASECPSAAERRQLSEQTFQGGEGELGLLEALKLLMLGRAVQLHGHMRAGEDVPLFCWLLFARDSSECPRSFLANHLGRVGLSAGLEQVEMFLLGYALQCTIQVYRLYKADTEEFVTYYPDDHRDEWPCVCLVTEDDRHYNVPVVAVAADAEVEWS